MKGITITEWLEAQKQNTNNIDISVAEHNDMISTVQMWMSAIEKARIEEREHIESNHKREIEKWKKLISKLESNLFLLDRI